MIHWKRQEARKRASELRRLGHRVNWEPTDPASIRVMKASPPDVFVIDLSRMPSQGRDIGVELRRTRATRLVPLVFMEGEPEKVKRVKQILPDAVFGSWLQAGDVLSRALDMHRKDPVVPESSFAAYAGVPLAKKLGIKPGGRIALVAAPDGFEQKLEPLPEGAMVVLGPGEKGDLVLWFVRTADELAGEIRRMRARASGKGLWIVWPKRSSHLATDLTQSIVRKAGLDAGLVDYKVCSVDSDWSGLKFTVRRSR
jgi:hypothetical protein